MSLPKSLTMFLMERRIKGNLSIQLMVTGLVNWEVLMISGIVHTGVISRCFEWSQMLNS